MPLENENLESNENQTIDTVPLAETIAGAKILGIASNGATNLFKISDIKGDGKGIADASTNPGAPVLSQYYFAKPGVTYANFKDANNVAITIPTEVDGNPVLTAKLIFNGSNWVAEYTAAEVDLVDVDFSFKNIEDTLGKKTLISNSFFNKDISEWQNSGGSMSFVDGNLKSNNGSNQYASLLGGFTTPNLPAGNYIFETRIKTNIRSNGEMRFKLDNVDYPFTLVNDSIFHTYKMPVKVTGQPTNFILYNGSISTEQEILIDYAILYDANQGVAALEPVSKLDPQSEKPVNSKAVLDNIGGINVVENGDFTNGVEGWVPNLADSIEAFNDAGKSTLKWNADGRKFSAILRTQDFFVGDAIIEIGLKANSIGDGKIGVELGGEKSFLDISSESAYHKYLYYRKLNQKNNTLILWNGNESNLEQELLIDYVKVYDYSALTGMVVNNLKELQEVNSKVALLQSQINSIAGIKYNLEADVNHFIGGGQSNDAGAAPAITLNVFSQNMMRFDNPLSPSGTFVPFAFEAGFGESPIGGMAIGLHELATARNIDLSKSKFLFSSTGVGGASILDLVKPQEAYNNILLQVLNAKNIANAMGKTYAVVSFQWTQGEANILNMSIGEYKAKLAQLSIDLNADVKNITGQKNDFPVILYQPSSFNGISYGTKNSDFPTLFPEMGEFVPGFYHANPDYNKSYLSEGGQEIHTDSTSSRLRGLEYAVVWDKLATGQIYQKLRIESHFISGKIVNLKFNKNLLLDTANVALIANYGFLLAGNTINSVQVNDNRITIICQNNIVAGSQLTYAFNAVDHSGKTQGPRGNVRSTEETIFSVDKVYDWLPHLKLVL
ncbi:hypothetical protein [Pedobacter agri]|uniref:hypothetical protein n=1 Tax=Pedobacter agri TaxID=454586 RepID=UPI00278575AD|nr:hypothetical protein [Pedobacter agri]MDQ1139407.1 hypothetical protein [Pedobacter agri]